MNIEFNFDKGRCFFNGFINDTDPKTGKKGVNYYRVCNCLGYLLEKLGFVYKIQGVHEGNSCVVWANRVSFNKWKDRHLDMSNFKTCSAGKAIQIICTNNRCAEPIEKNAVQSQAADPYQESEETLKKAEEINRDSVRRHAELKAKSLEANKAHRQKLVDTIAHSTDESQRKRAEMLLEIHDKATKACEEACDALH